MSGASAPSLAVLRFYVPPKLHQHLNLKEVAITDEHSCKGVDHRHPAEQRRKSFSAERNLARFR